jgi:hypothetical protein
MTQAKPSNEMVLIVAGNRDEANQFLRAHRNKGGSGAFNPSGDNRAWNYLEDVRELAHVDTALVIYTGTYLQRPDIHTVVERIGFMQAGKKCRVELIPLDPLAPEQRPVFGRVPFMEVMPSGTFNPHSRRPAS